MHSHAENRTDKALLKTVQNKIQGSHILHGFMFSFAEIAFALITCDH